MIDFEKWDINSEKIENYVTILDWKCQMADVLICLRKDYPDCNTLNSETLDLLAENYYNEEPHVALDALGQELSTLGHALFGLESDGDCYWLYLLTLDRSDDFKAFCKKNQINSVVLKQKRKQIGKPATRIKLHK